MDEIVPIQFINNNFRITIKKLSEAYRSGNVIYYNAVTMYGTMCLIIENYSDLILGQNALEFLNSRKKIMYKYYKYFPIVFEQQICVNHPQQIVCITLIQKCKHLHQCINQVKDKIRVSTISKMVRLVHVLDVYNIDFDGQLQIDKLLWLNSNNQITIDFTKIRPDMQSKSSSLLMRTVNSLQNLLQFRYLSEQYRQIALIRDKVYIFNPQFLKKASDLLQLAIMLNLLPDLLVEIEIKAISKNKNANQSTNKITRIKSLKLNQLEGKQIFKLNQKQYQTLSFSEGKCTNCYEQITYNEIKSKFLQENAYYKLQKLQTPFIQKGQFMKGCSKLEQDVISVHPPVSKIQVINFIIAYMKWIQPIVKTISYLPVENSLKIEFTNKLSEQKRVKIIFYDEYVIKNEEISMIVQRAKLKDCVIDLRHMKINDAFLMFLANSQKTTKISEIHLNDCSGITDNGINVMLISPFCKNLQALSLVFDDGLLASSMQSLSLKSGLKKLHIERSHNNEQVDSKTEIDTANLKLVQLSSIGIRIKLSSINPTYLRVLKIDQTVNLEQLKSIRNLALVQLKIRIMQFSKKSIIESTSSFLAGALIGKNSAVKAFAEGPSHKTLKILDISYSNARFKTLRALLLMGQLQKVSLDGCLNLGNEFDHISPKILQVSLADIQLQIQQLAAIVHKIPVLVQLNIINNASISRQQLIKFIIDKKKFINNLMISQNCFSNKLIEKMMGPDNINSFELVENVHLYVDRILQVEYEHLFYNMIKKVSQTPKTLRIMTYYGQKCKPTARQRKKRVLLTKINNYIKVSNKKLKDFKNLFIDKIRYEQLHDDEINNIITNNDQGQEIMQKNCEYCRIVSAPKIKVSSKHTQFNVLEDETIDNVIQRFAKLMHECRHSDKIQFNMSNNRLIDAHIIRMIMHYGSDNISSINFTNCIFRFDDVVDLLMQFPIMEQVNDGEYSIKLNKHNFLSLSQRYLKFFMKLKPIRKLAIDCTQVQQIQILYSVLYHIIDKHSQSLQSLKVQLNSQIINQQSDMFIQKIFDIQDLQQLQIKEQHCSLKYKHKRKDNMWQDGLARLKKLKKLVLRLPTLQYPQINNKRLQHLQLSVSDEQMQEAAMNKIIKHIHTCPLKSLSISLNSCKDISNLNKIFNAGPSMSLLQRLTQLQSIQLDIQNCNLKQQSVHQTLTSIGKCQSIRSLWINVSFAISNINELVNAVNKMVNAVNRPIKVVVVCVTQNSSKYVMNHEYNNQNGIEYIL